MCHGGRTRTERRPRPCRPGLDGMASAACIPPCAVSSPGHVSQSLPRITQRHTSHSSVALASASMHAACGRPAPQTRMGAWPGLCCVRSGWAMDAVHGHRDQRCASRASRNDTNVHACPGPQRAQTPSIGAHSAGRPPQARGCAVPTRLRAAPDPSGVQGRRSQRCTRTGTGRSAVHAAEHAAG